MVGFDKTYQKQKALENLAEVGLANMAICRANDPEDLVKICPSNDTNGYIFILILVNRYR